MRPSSSIGLHWSSIPLAILIDSRLSRGWLSTFVSKFEQLGLSPVLDEAFRFYSQPSQVSHTVSLSNIDAAKSWATSAEQFHHGSALLAHQTVLRFLAARCRSVVLLTPFRCDEDRFIILCKRMCFRAVFAMVFHYCCRTGGTRSWSILDPVGALLHTTG
ncbi:uncharacterized protein F5891DRAFT_161552 [Suillus fuscotomentosus]|uniref:Uncharacterized protein n=1 Tax=Suillus fuscotomentosus TaxID=1912939 RepID=A0AAD4ECB5_9AGAM|nr:uncharacterized protein F5891DRAFT_161552 [Suillus fuscotomentosus]KAG1902374.1 hypothetical protein F5891DRAFT_161552 [Suillus fuscotomentosus]